METIAVLLIASENFMLAILQPQEERGKGLWAQGQRKAKFVHLIFLCTFQDEIWCWDVAVQVESLESEVYVMRWKQLLFY